MIEIDNELYQAIRVLGEDVVIELARGLVRARMLHPVFAESAAEGAAVVYTEASGLVASVHDRESVARQRAEAVDTAVTAIRYMGKFGVTSPVETSEGVKVAFDADDDFEGLREAAGASGKDDVAGDITWKAGEKAERMYTSPSLPKHVWAGLDGASKCTPTQRGSVLSEAINIINGERQDVYGSPEDSFSLISDYWTTYLRSRSPEIANAGFCLFADDVALMMVLFKIAREANQHKRDNIIDAAGYLGIYADMQERKDG